MKEERTKKAADKLSPIYAWSRYVFGIDPGLKGGIACVDNLTGTVTLARPTPTQTDAASGKPTYDVNEMHLILSLCKNYPEECSVVIERQQAMPKQGVVSMFTTGFGYGIWTALIALTPIPISRKYVVRPADWQIILRGEDAKDDTKAKSIARVHRVFSGVDLCGGNKLKRTPSDGIADAINIAHYVCLRMVPPV